MPLSFAVSDFIGSLLSHVAHGYVEALTSCLFIALARAMVFRSFTSTYRR
jgi:hypothetical protein